MVVCNSSSSSFQLRAGSQGSYNGRLLQRLHWQFDSPVKTKMTHGKIGEDKQESRQIVCQLTLTEVITRLPTLFEIILPEVGNWFANFILAEVGFHCRLWL